MMNTNLMMNTNNMVKDFSNELRVFNQDIHPGVNDVKSGDNQPYDIKKLEENFSNKQAIHPNVDNAEIWNINVVENLNESWGKTDYDMTTKNIDPADISNLSYSKDNSQRFDSNMNSPSETDYIKPPLSKTNFINYGQTLDCCVCNSVSIQKSGAHLNVDAQEFKPSIFPVPSGQRTDYGSFDVSKLLECDLRFITNAALWDYTYALREKIINCVKEYDYFVKDSLSFFSDLMEERQSERTQMLINERMHKIACKYFNELDYYGNFGYGSKLYDSNSVKKDILILTERKGILERDSNRDDMHNQNKRQNFRSRYYYNGQEANSSKDFPQRSKINSERKNFTNREGKRYSVKRNKSYTQFSGRDYFYKDRFSGEVKEDSNEEFSCRKNWSSKTDNSVQNEKISGSENKISSRYSSNSRNHAFYREKEYKQNKISGRGNRNSTEVFYHEEFLGGEKENTNKGYSKQEKFYDKYYSQDYSGHTGNNSDSGNQSSDKDISDCRKKDYNSEMDYNQKEISGKRESDVGGKIRNFYSGSKIISRGRKYSSQGRLSSKEESHSNQETFSNTEEKKTGRGYNKIRKKIANQGRGSAAQQ